MTDKEDPRNIGYVCPAHAPKPDEALAELPLEYFIGKFVKLGFPSPRGTEHMWLEVKGLATNMSEELIGTLDNDPVHADFVCGDEIAFNRDEIEDVFYEN
tara:strand:+ start:758 stop:1057 length:300 start_codon:yes stop_codon:yes gene_type:complete